MTQNEKSKIAYDYVMMLRNNIFERMVYYFKDIDYLKHTTREKIRKQQLRNSIFQQPAHIDLPNISKGK